MRNRRKAPRGLAKSRPASRPLLFLYRALLALALVLGLGILGGTLYAAFRGSGEDKTAGGQAGPEAGEAVFTGLGRLRIPLAPPGNSPAGSPGADNPPLAGQPPGEGRAALIISIAFPYPPGDRAFAEELASKTADFRRIAVDYFSARSAEELRSPAEENIKAELLGAYNSVLRLGKIRTLYFNDLLLLE
jgi:flagellar basal body-associated protein FliL